MDEFDRIVYMLNLQKELDEVGELSLPPMQMYSVPQQVVDALKEQ